MSKLRVVFVALALAACGGGDSPPPAVDAPSNLPACTMALFDNCVTNDDCTSANCHFFMQSNFSICTQACDASNPCPNDKSGTPGSCNNMGICKPSVANGCTP